MSPEWLAGFFDGEGCVRLVKHPQYPNYYHVLFLTQKDVGVLRRIQAEFGGHLRSKRCASNCAFLQWNGNEAVVLAERMLPYSDCKHDQLAVFIEAAKVPPRDRAPLAALITEMKGMIELIAA